LNTGASSLPVTQKTPEGLQARIWVALSVFFLTVLTLLRQVAYPVTKKFSALSSNDDRSTSEPPTDTTNMEVLPTSSTPQCTEENLLPSMLKRLGELEEKVDTLQSKPSEMPYEKEELLNAAVCRVDALEAELIATKKVGCLRYFLLFEDCCIMPLLSIFMGYMCKALRCIHVFFFLFCNLKLKNVIYSIENINICMELRFVCAFQNDKIGGRYEKYGV